MGKVVSKATNNEGRVRLDLKNRMRNYKNFENHPATEENGNVVIEENDERPKGSQRKVDALLQLRKRPVSAFIHSGTDGLYVWFISTWMRLKQKHYGKLSDSDSSTSSRSSSRKYSRENNDQPVINTIIERTNSTESNDLDLADISDSSDSGRSSAASQDNHLNDLDMYSIRYFNEKVNDFQSKNTSEVRTLGSRNPSFSLNDE